MMMSRPRLVRSAVDASPTRIGRVSVPGGESVAREPVWSIAFDAAVAVTRLFGINRPVRTASFDAALL